MKSRIGSVLAVLLLAACGGGGDGDTSSLRGANIVGDPVDDHERAVNANGKTPRSTDALDSADIRGVRMDADGKTLTITIGIGGAPLMQIPLVEQRGPAWFVQLWDTDKATGEPSYFVVITREGAPAAEKGGSIKGWRLSVCEGRQVCTEPTPGTKLTISGLEVKAEIPLDRVEKLRNPFSWIALSYWNTNDDPTNAWSDYVPDAARLQPGATTFPPPEARATFPPEQ